VADGVRFVRQGVLGGLGGRPAGPTLEHFLRERAGLVADAQFGLIGGATVLNVAFDDVEDRLDALTQRRMRRQTLIETASGGLFPNRRLAQGLSVHDFLLVVPLYATPSPR
jgi:hypothetical protein